MPVVRRSVLAMGWGALTVALGFGAFRMVPRGQTIRPPPPSVVPTHRVPPTASEPSTMGENAGDGAPGDGDEDLGEGGHTATLSDSAVIENCEGGHRSLEQRLAYTEWRVNRLAMDYPDYADPEALLASRKILRDACIEGW